MTALSTFDSVQMFIANYWRVRPAKVTLSTTLERDLGITGEDGIDFMAAFFTEFGIDYAGFDVCNYFDPEGFDPIGLSILLRKLLRLPPLRFPIYDLMVADLVKVVDRKKWINPVICSRSPSH